jgi:hypothetical protein
MAGKEVNGPNRGALQRRFIGYEAVLVTVVSQSDLHVDHFASRRSAPQHGYGRWLRDVRYDPNYTLPTSIALGWGTNQELFLTIDPLFVYFSNYSVGRGCGRSVDLQICEVLNCKFAKQFKPILGGSANA